MIRSKIDTEDFLFLLNKNCERLSEQTHRKGEEILEFKPTKPRETFHIQTPISIEGYWMISLTSLEV